MNVQLFLETLPIMGKGMLGIFLVTLVLILGTCVMNRLTSHGEDDRRSGS